MYKFIGSAEILGNPISLISNMGAGVSDFFTEPVKAIVHSPSDLGLGIKRGTYSFVSKSTYAVANSVGKVTGGLAHLASFFTFDEEYQKEWAKNYRSARDQPKNAVDGLQKAAQNAGSGVIHAVLDVVNSPIQGAKTGGATGAITGTLKSASGVFAKLSVSVLGSASTIAQGIENTVVGDVNRMRIRLPRYIGENGVLLPYDEDQAAGHLLLQFISNGEFSNEWYHNSFSLKDGGVLIISNIRLLIVKDSYITFNIPFYNIKGFQLTQLYIVILPIIPPQKSYFQFYAAAKETYIIPLNSSDVVPLYEQLLSTVRDSRRRSRI